MATSKKFQRSIKVKKLLFCIGLVVLVTGLVIYYFAQRDKTNHMPTDPCAGTYQSCDEYPYSNSQSVSTQTVKVVTYPDGVCTQDEPTSSCSSYNVKMQLSNGKEISYTVAGFNGRGSIQQVLYDKITSKLRQAKQDDSSVEISINSKNVIISAQ